ncbi:MAG: C25 family cysteine peptidase [Bacteroidota bacterium]
MRKITLLSLIFLLLSVTSSFAQMGDGKFGNEWINHNQSYYKIMLAEDGIYRLSRQTLLQNGIPADAIPGNNYQLYYMGEQVPIYTSSNGVFQNNDFIAFYGKKNRSELDRELFANPAEEMLNPEYSLYTDSSAYFLTWGAGNHPRIATISNNLSNLPAKEEYFMHDLLLNFTDTHVKRKTGSSGNALSTYGLAEGFSTGFPSSRIHLSAVEPPHLLSTGPDTEVSVRFATKEGEHHQVVKVNDREYAGEEFFGYAVKQFDFTINTAEMGTTANVKVEGLKGGSDRQAVANIRLRYPRLFNFDAQNAFLFSIRASSSSKYLEIENFDAGGSSPILYDVTNQTRMPVRLEGSTVRIALPPSSSDRELVLINANSGFRTISQLQSIEFIDYTQEDADFLIITNKRLTDDGQGRNRVQEYADYRSSVRGGDYTTYIAEIQQLYDQFSYGIHRHPLSIRNFTHFIKQQWSDPKYVFIIGKAREYAFYRKTSELNASINSSFTVPTFGLPGADNLLLARNTSNTPIIPVGRLAVSSPQDIAIYLDKVRVLEENMLEAGQSIEGKEWIKRILHLSGGGTGEQSTIASYLGQMEAVIETNEFGGDVTTFYKTSSDPVQISTSDEIFNLINEGVSMITFFGHSGVGTFDFNIDNPDNYNNFGKYPMITSLGCYSGNIHTPVVGTSERFVFYEDKGAIAFLASTGQGFTGTLFNFMREYYRLQGSTQYGESIGNILNATIRRFENAGGQTMRELVQQFTINGDPALVLNAAPGPDYIVDPQSVAFEPSLVTIQQDSFDLLFTINNIGRFISDSMSLEIIQELPNNNRITIIRDRIPVPAFSKNVSYRIPTSGKESVGLNRFYVNLDVLDEIEELPDPQAEANNELMGAQGQLGKELFIVDNSIRAAYPREFGIVNNRDVVLKASTGNALAAEQKYIFELDTTQAFNSPIKVRGEVTQPGGVVKWKPTLGLSDNTVYYWRVSRDSLSPELGFIWESSSFIYIEDGQDGWNQSHYYQYQRSASDGMRVDEDSRNFEFNTNGFFITINNKVNEPGNEPSYVYNFETPAVTVRPWDQIDAGVAVVIGDGVNGSAWANTDGAYGSVNPNRYTNVFAFPTNTAEERKTLVDFLNDAIPANSYVFLFTVLNDFNQNFEPEQWAGDTQVYGTNLYEVLEAQGATLARTMSTQGSLPYTFVYQKDAQVFDEKLASAFEEEIKVEVFIPISRTDGNIRSTVVGPALEWESLSWAFSNVDDPISDITHLTLFGLDKNFAETVLIDSLTKTDTSLNFVSAEEYPYLRLQYNAKDETNRTSTHLDFWRINYTGLPEAALDPASHFVFYNDTLQQGDVFRMESVVENLSDYDMDSLLVKFTVTDQLNNAQIAYKKLAPLTKADTLHFSHQLSTTNLSGLQNIVVEVNPEEDQPEESHFNNFLASQFKIAEDIRNPNLDVTFDGLHIMNGDIVSSRPDIQVVLKDENRFLRLVDTALFRIFLHTPDGGVNKISFQDPNLEFFPATETDNRASVQYRPILDVDGSYQLIIQAEDATGNQSGDFDYKVSFEISNRKAISNVLNYPNPFSTSTQFIYTLTGHEPPEQFRIQIMTVSGRVVREITQAETGPLQIGTHKIDYVWDGTDEFGDRLANGVYLYRMVAKGADGQDFERHDTRTSQYFKNDFGKLVIMR